MRCRVEVEERASTALLRAADGIRDCVRRGESPAEADQNRGAEARPRWQG